MNIPHLPGLARLGLLRLFATPAAALLLSLSALAQTAQRPAEPATNPAAMPAVTTLEAARTPPARGTVNATATSPQTTTSLPTVGTTTPEDVQPTEFERYVARVSGLTSIRRFGAQLVTPELLDADVPDYNAIVPPEYVLQAGDEVALTIWGSVDADLRLVIDRSGRVSIPRVGSVMLAGLRYSELADTLRKRIALVFKNFDLSVALGQLRGVRIYVTGFVRKPGALTVSALSTITAALYRAGGPSTAGSLREIELRRGGRVVAKFDLYDLLIRGNRDADAVLQPGDLLNVAAIGPQVALIGSVNQPAIFELKPNENLADLVNMAGGFAPTADSTRLTLERLDDRSTVRVIELALPSSLGATLRNADVLHALSAVASTLPVARQNKRIQVEGEVSRPGVYLLPPDSTLSSALKAAGGLTASAFVYGSEFTRESARRQQEQNYERALRDLETDMTRRAAGQRVSSAEEVSAQAARATSTNRLLERLRAVKPTGRIVLQMTPDSGDLPELALEDGDRLFIPPRPVTVGVFGSVFNPGSYLYSPSRDLQHYLRLAGGPMRAADTDNIFVIRSNGTVVSARQSSNWLGVSNSFWNQPIEPGDTIFAPEEVDKATVVQHFKDWSQILYQFGLGVAGLKIVGF